MSVIHIEKQNYDELIKEGVVLVDFYAEWCGPCKMLAPVLAALSDQRNEIKVVKVNVDEQNELAHNFGVMSVPTLFLYKNGAIVAQRSGFQTLDMLNDWINENIK